MISKNNFNILKINNALSFHVHEFGGILGSPTGPPVSTAAMLVPVTVSVSKQISTAVTTSFNMGMNKLNYLDKNFPKYINSRHVNTTWGRICL